MADTQEAQQNIPVDGYSVRHAPVFSGTSVEVRRHRDSIALMTILDAELLSDDAEEARARVVAITLISPSVASRLIDDLGEAMEDLFQSWEVEEEVKDENENPAIAPE